MFQADKKNFLFFSLTNMAQPIEPEAFYRLSTVVEKAVDKSVRKPSLIIDIIRFLEFYSNFCQYFKNVYNRNFL